jgi:hypothetical protein
MVGEQRPPERGERSKQRRVRRRGRERSMFIVVVVAVVQQAIVAFVRRVMHDLLP